MPKPTVSEVKKSAFVFNGEIQDNAGKGMVAVAFPSLMDAVKFKAANVEWVMDIPDGDTVMSLYDGAVLEVDCEPMNYGSHDVWAEIRARIEDYETEGHLFETSAEGYLPDTGYVYVTKNGATKKFRVKVTEA